VNWNRIRAVMRKDLRELGANQMVVIPMAIVPAVMCVLVPCAIMIAVLSVGADQLNRGADLIMKLTPLYDVPAGFVDPVSRLLYVVLNYTFLPMFMIIPVMMATLVSANAIVGEKERKTLETLLSTPLTNRELIVAKLLVSFLPAIALSWMAFAAFFLAANAVALIMMRQLIVSSWIWLPALLLLSPAVSLVGLSLTLLVSLKARTFQAAQQFAALIVLPLVALVVMQITGVVVLNALYVVLFSLALLALAWILIMRVLPRFTREGIISTL
jgi:ABC-2 type transport system permease protein